MRFLTGLLAIALITSTAATADDSAERAAILAQSKAFSDAYVRGDTATLMEIYAPGASIVPTNRPIMTGHDHLSRYWGRTEGATHIPVRHKATPEELVIDGTMAADIGYFEGATQDRDGAEHPFRGAYLITWRKLDGVWRIQHDMWNRLPTNDPAKGAANDSGTEN